MLRATNTAPKPLTWPFERLKANWSEQVISNIAMNKRSERGRIVASNSYCSQVAYIAYQGIEGDTVLNE